MAGWKGARGGVLVQPMYILPHRNLRYRCPHFHPSPPWDACPGVENDCEQGTLWACALGGDRLVKTRETDAWSNREAKAYTKTNK